MALYLVQHGKSLSKDQDPQKGLSEEGAVETRRIAEVAANYGKWPTSIRFAELSSVADITAGSSNGFSPSIDATPWTGFSAAAIISAVCNALCLPLCVILDTITP